MQFEVWVTGRVAGGKTVVVRTPQELWDAITAALTMTKAGVVVVQEGRLSRE